MWFCIVFILAMLKVSTEHIIENKERGVQQIQNVQKHICYTLSVEEQAAR